MSVERSNSLLVVLGVITALATITVQISSLGEIKGRLETTIKDQDKRITTVELVVREHDRMIYQHMSKTNETKK